MTVKQLESRLVIVEAQVQALLTVIGSPNTNAPAQSTPAQTNGQQGEPRWLASARFGGKPCPGGCGRIVQQGSRAWYEPKIVTARGTVPAQLFCIPCGEEREKAAKP